MFWPGVLPALAVPGEEEHDRAGAIGAQFLAECWDQELLMYNEWNEPMWPFQDVSGSRGDSG